ncbi:hypothetical protein [Vibrio nitrifigilis]|uniref:Uncharacterized protein n=1 Tax=Vibrio nitrifigilis TaxID=2789781 RepID=A0ABS0GDL2_9VIBR|nr:hypothetical protein [Vibrio nitrifigilis]MBF9000338.1 hypothetical protein [Vibrio nitrifigilis]
MNLPWIKDRIALVLVSFVAASVAYGTIVLLGQYYFLIFDIAVGCVIAERVYRYFRRKHAKDSA